MKYKNKIIIILILALSFFSLSTNLSYAKEVDQEQNTDSLTVTFDNGDGTYTTVFNSSQTAVQIIGNDYITMGNSKSGEAKIVLSEDIIIDNPETDIKVGQTHINVDGKRLSSFTYDKTNRTINWQTDLIMKPDRYESVIIPIPDFGVIENKIWYNPLNYIEITYRIDPSLSGRILPVESAGMKTLAFGADKDEFFSVQFFLEAIYTKVNQSYNAKIEFFNDEKMTIPATDATNKDRLFVKYTIKPTGKNISKDNFLKTDIDLVNVSIDASTNLINKFNKNTSYEVGAFNDTGVKVITGEIITSSLTDQTLEIINNINFNGTIYKKEVDIHNTNTLGFSDLPGEKYIELKTRETVNDSNLLPRLRNSLATGELKLKTATNMKQVINYEPFNKTQEAVKEEVTASNKLPFRFIKDVTIIFDANGGLNPPNSITTSSGTVVTKPNIEPAKEGYTFKGWTTVKNGNALYDFAQALNEDTTVYAKWEAVVVPVQKLSLIFDSNGGINGPSIIVVDKGSKVTKPNIEPTKEGYIFKGWTTVKNGNALYDFAQVLNVDTTVYAKWEKDVQLPKTGSNNSPINAIFLLLMGTIVLYPNKENKLI